MRILTLFLLLFSVSLPAQAQESEKAEASFRAFLDEAATRRLEQVKKLYELKSSLLSEEYQEQRAVIEEINALSRQMKVGDREHNKKLREQIRKKWASIKEEKKENREKVEKLRDEFKRENKERRKKIKELMKEFKD